MTGDTHARRAPRSRHDAGDARRGARRRRAVAVRPRRGLHRVLRACSAGRSGSRSSPTTRSSGTCGRASTSSTTASRTTTSSRSPRRAPSGSRSRGSPRSPTASLYRSASAAFGIRCFVGLVGAGIGMLAYRLALRLARDRVVAVRAHRSPRSPASTPSGRSGRSCSACCSSSCCSGPSRCPTASSAATRWSSCPVLHLAVGQHARQLRSSASPTWRCTCSALGRRRTAVGGPRTQLLVGAAIGVRRGVREPVRRRAGDVPDRSSSRAATSCRTSSSGSRPTSARRGASRSASGSWCSSWRWRAVATGSRAVT